jgi:hypothetical protein
MRLNTYVCALIGATSGPMANFFFFVPRPFYVRKWALLFDERNTGNLIPTWLRGKVSFTAKVLAVAGDGWISGI